MEDDVYVDINYDRMGRDPEYRAVVNNRNLLLRLLGNEHQRVQELEAENQALRERLQKRSASSGLAAWFGWFK